MVFRAKILNIALSMALLLGITSCVSNADVVDGKTYPLAVSVSDSGFTSASGTKSTTRATESGYVTTFAKGDQIGLYVVNSSNTVETANLCLTYDGTNWNYPTGTTLYYDITANRKYFAYYPYQSTLTGAPTLSSTSTATDAATFFATAISDWTPATDQSSQAKYTASDLMVGTGSIGALLSNATRQIFFSMSHKMALVDMNFPYYYLSTDNNYTYTLGLTCNGFKPYHLSKGNYRYIIKPATSTSIWGYYCTTTSANTNQIFNKAFTVAAGTYQALNVDNTATSTSYTMNIGDYYLNDGSVIPNATTNKYLIKKIIAVIFSRYPCPIEQNDGFTHGIAMALLDGNGGYDAHWSANSPTSLPVGNTYVTTDEAAYNDTISGYNGGIKQNYGTKSDFYAYYYCGNYYENNTVSANASSNHNSGWYLPSLGEIWRLWKNLGGITPDKSSSYGVSVNPGSTAYNTFVAYFTNSTINAEISNAKAPILTWHWTASEFSNTNGCIYDYYNTYAYFINYSKVGTTGVFFRPVLAF